MSLLIRGLAGPGTVDARDSVAKKHALVPQREPSFSGRDAPNLHKALTARWKRDGDEVISHALILRAIV